MAWRSTKISRLLDGVEVDKDILAHWLIHTGLFDACKRNGYASTPAGQFFSSGGCALIGFWVVWPFENLKNQAQAGMNWLAHARTTGLLGLYRGIVPGSASVFLRNGAAMIVMQRANRLITDLGLRE